MAVGEAEGIRSEAKVPERGVEWPGKGPQAGPRQDRKLQCRGPIPAPLPCWSLTNLEQLCTRPPGWEGLTPLSGSRPPRPVRGPSLGLSGFSLRLGATVPTSPGSGG